MLHQVFYGVRILGNNDSYGSSIHGNTDHQMNIYNIDYHDNDYSNYGTGFRIIAYSGSTINNIIVENNELGYCDALYLRFCDSVNFKDIIVKNNHSDHYSSSINLSSSSDVIMDRVIIEGNVNENGGPMLNLYNTENIIITNALIKDNISNGDFSMIYISDSSLYIINSTIINNTNNCGAIITSLYNSMLEPYLINTILYGNEIAQIQLGRPSIRSRILHVNHCDIEDGEEGVILNDGALLYWEEGNIDEDPLFTGLEPYPYTIMGSSPCIDAGTLDFPVYFEMPETDLAGNPRISGDGIDLGCYEYQYPNTDNDEVVVENIEMICYPNPFNPETTINFNLLESVSNVSIKIYNVKGQLVQKLLDSEMDKGAHQVVWKGDNISGSQAGSGIYFYQLKAGDITETRKMMLIK